jgi:predicted kinase
LVRRIHGAQLRFLQLCRESLEDRVRDGRVVDGHGDLRPEHIYLAPDPQVIDCIEFNAEFRTLDVADELAFLAMECEKLDAGHIGNQVLARYQEVSGDRPSRLIVDFFKCYRACVRAKVCALRAAQVEGRNHERQEQTAAGYLNLAATYADRLGKPLLLVVRGTSGTGKSTLAAAISQAWSAELLQTDEVRRELFPAHGVQDDYGAGRYSRENRGRVYDELLRRAGEDLRQGLTVIVDGTFLARDSRARAIQSAEQHGALALIVNCHCPEHIARERIQERQLNGTSASEARSDFVAQQRLEEEGGESNWPACDVDTSEGLVKAWEVISENLKSRYGYCRG